VSTAGAGQHRRNVEICLSASFFSNIRLVIFPNSLISRVRTSRLKSDEEKGSGLFLFVDRPDMGFFFRGVRVPECGFEVQPTGAIDSTQFSRPKRDCHAGSTANRHRSSLSAELLRGHGRTPVGRTGPNGPWGHTVVAKVHRLNPNGTRDRPTPFPLRASNQFGTLCVCVSTYRQRTWKWLSL